MGELDSEIPNFNSNNQGYRTSMEKNILISLACSALSILDTATLISRRLW